MDLRALEMTRRREQGDRSSPAGERLRAGCSGPQGASETR